MDKMPLTAIVLHGGGSLGAYECGVLKAIYEDRNKLYMSLYNETFHPAVITGISIGAVNAAILAGAGINQLEDIWLDELAFLENHHGSAPIPSAWSNFAQYAPPFMQPYLKAMEEMAAQVPANYQALFRDFLPPMFQQSLGVWGNQSMYSLRPEYLFLGPVATFLTPSIYDTSPLRETLLKRVDFDALNNIHNDCRVVVTAVNVETGKITHFGNRLSLKEAAAHQAEDEFGNHDYLTVDHVMASGSLPWGFPPTWVDGGYYYDGALIYNTPLSIAINCLERIENKEHRPLEVIVVELFPMEGNLPQNVWESMLRFYNIIYSSKLKLDSTLFHRLNNLIDLANEIKDLKAELAKLDKKVHEDAQLKTQKDLCQEIDSANRKVTGIAKHAGYLELTNHKKIDYFTLVPYTGGQELANSTDFSLASIKRRIEAGKTEAQRQEIGQPKEVELTSALHLVPA
jgi:predicted acylesterase/phospholipase RssA